MHSDFLCIQETRTISGAKKLGRIKFYKLLCQNSVDKFMEKPFSTYSFVYDSSCVVPIQFLKIPCKKAVILTKNVKNNDLLTVSATFSIFKPTKAFAREQR